MKELIQIKKKHIGLALKMPRQLTPSGVDEGNKKAVLAFFSVVASSQIFPLLRLLSELRCKGNKKI